MTTHTPLTVLVAEDDEVDMIGIRRAFSKLGLANPIVHAIDGVEAWSHVADADGKPRADMPGLILLDLNMPRLTGHAFLDKFFALTPAPTADVFVLTTSDTDQDIVDAYRHPVRGYLLKSDLLESLREGLDGLNRKWMLLD